MTLSITSSQKLEGVVLGGTKGEGLWVIMRHEEAKNEITH
jgi:hypothetical protein